MYIDIKEIWEKTNGGELIFRYYFPEFKEKKHFKLRDEKTASANIYRYNELYYLNDFGEPTQKAMNAVEYVMEEEGLQFADALKFIMDVIIRQDISSRSYKKPSYQPKYSSRNIGPDDKNGINIADRRDKLSNFELKTLGRYVTQKICEEYNVRAVDKYEVVNLKKSVVHVFEATDDYPIYEFAYDGFSKIYQPKAADKKHRFMFIGNPPRNYIYGYKQLKKKQNEVYNPEDYNDATKIPEEPHLWHVIRVSGPTDMLNMASLGFHCYHLNNETHPMPHNLFQEVDKMAKSHFQLMDIDETGREAAKSFGMYYLDVKDIRLPEWLKQKKDNRGKPRKDIKDFIEITGKNRDQTFHAVNALLHDAIQFRFWDRVEKSDEGLEFKIRMKRLFEFLTKFGYYRMRSSIHKNGYAFLRVNFKMVSILDGDEMKVVKSSIREDLRNFIQEGKFFTRHLYIPRGEKEWLEEKIINTNQLSEDKLMSLPEITLNFKNYSAHYETLIAKNKALRITKDKIETIKHEDLQSHVVEELKVGNKLDISQLISFIKMDGTRHFFNIEKYEADPITVTTTKEYQELLNKLDGEPENRDKIIQQLSNFNALEKYRVTINITDNYYINFLWDVSRLYWREEEEYTNNNGKSYYPDGREPHGVLTEEQIKEQELNFINLLYTIGYVLRQYKSPAQAWLALIQDALITRVGNSAGRSGKSRIMEVLKYFRPTFEIPAREEKAINQNEFLYDGLTELHDVRAYDDVHEKADPNKFYTATTEGINVNSKHIRPTYLAYSQTGKGVATTNHSWKDNSPSATDRLLTAQVSDYYHRKTPFNDYRETRKPDQKYGRLLYIDFTEKEWSELTHLIAYAIQLNMRFPKIEAPQANLHKRMLQQMMEEGLEKLGGEFQSWADEYFQIEDKEQGIEGTLNTHVKRENAQEAFNETLTRPLSSQKFKKKLIYYCYFKDYEFNPIEKCSNKKQWQEQFGELPESQLTYEMIGKKRILLHDDAAGKKKEYFYIRPQSQFLTEGLMKKIEEFFSIYEIFPDDLSNNAQEYCKEFNKENNLSISVEEFRTAAQKFIDENNIEPGEMPF